MARCVSVRDNLHTAVAAGTLDPFQVIGRASVGQFGRIVHV